MKAKKFCVDLTCDYAQWWRYNVYISMVCYNSDSQIIDYCNSVDKIFDIEYEAEHRVQPADYPTDRIIRLESTPCDHVTLYLYIIANTFPQSTIVRDSPDFDVDVRIDCDGKQLKNTRYKVNQLGGMTIAGELISV